MGLFGLDPDSVAGRIRAGGPMPEIPSLAKSLRRGLVGFTLLSVAGFAPWALGGRWFYRNTGEAGLYAVCALVFIGLSGPLLHRLILGPGSLARFYQLFSVAFTAYSILWTAGFMTLRGHAGSLAGLLAGNAAMGWILARAFGSGRAAPRIIAALFLLNSAGFFAGGLLEAAVVFSEPARGLLARLLWGVCYGIGFGTGLGLAFHLAQERTRVTLGALKAGRAG